MAQKYYKPSLPRSLYYAILKLFEENEYIRNLYDDNPVKLIEDAIRDKIMELRVERDDRLKKELNNLTKNND